MERKTVFNLYGTEGCHLCEEAVLQLHSLLEPSVWDYVDIINDNALLADYSTRIPVLRYLRTTEELNGPFDSTELKIFLSRTGNPDKVNHS